MGEETLADDDLLDVVEQLDGPAFTTGELANRTGLALEAVRQRLETLHDRGKVHKKTPSPGTVIWWLDDVHDSPAFSAK